MIAEYLLECCSVAELIEEVRGDGTVGRLELFVPAVHVRVPCVHILSKFASCSYELPGKIWFALVCSMFGSVFIFGSEEMSCGNFQL